MKKIQISLMIFILMMVLMACSSNNEKELDGNSNNTGNSETTQENTEKDPVDQEEGSDSKYFALGETAEINSGSGDYEITVNSFKLLDEFEGEKPTRDTFILVEFEVENISDSSIVAEDIYGATIFETEELSAENTYHYDSIEVFGDEEIQPGEIKEGEYLFSHTESDTYFLHINYGILDSVATNVIYELPIEKASS